MHAAGDVRIEDVPDAAILDPTDALVRVTRACICGSDLWPYWSMERSETGQSMGHEAIGVVEDVGAEVRAVKRGDVVVMPFAYSDGSCVFCREGLHTSCIHGGFFGSGEADGAQAEALRVPQADGTLVVLPVGADDALMPSLVTLSDVMGTGHHAAVVAGVGPGKTAAVVGDGAVGLCGVIAARRLGAEQIIILGRHPDRIALAREFGATDVVPERGDEGVARIKELTGGLGAHSVIEAVGNQESMMQAIRSTRPGGHVGYVGVSHGVSLPGEELFFSGVHLHGGPAPVRRFLPELIELIWNRTIDPGRVFDLELPLERAAEGYRAMDERRAIKTLLRP
jgi:threonine dehydrogenase-like Zn-dependent dehydrogenase